MMNKLSYMLHPDSYKGIQERRHQEVLQKLLENAHTYAWEEGHKGISSSQQETPLPDENQLGKFPGPFSRALKIVRERKMCQDELIKWKSSKKVRNVS